MSECKVSAAALVTELLAARERRDGYIMGATGQNPQLWREDSWWFAQYDGNADEKRMALYWREHARRVWDCNGLAEGIYKDATGVDINTRARHNYAQWCGVKGVSMIPAAYRVPGAAVFWGGTAAKIEHVAYLVRPVDEAAPAGDWYLVEARGVKHGVVQTRLSQRKPVFWGLMTRYFDYGLVPLMQGTAGDMVRDMQQKLLALGYDLGKCGADGDFGPATQAAVKRFQLNHGLPQTGVMDEAGLALLNGDGLCTLTIRGMPMSAARALMATWPDCELMPA